MGVSLKTSEQGVARFSIHKQLPAQAWPWVTTTSRHVHALRRLNQGKARRFYHPDQPGEVQLPPPGASYSVERCHRHCEGVAAREPD